MEKTQVWWNFLLQNWSKEVFNNLSLSPCWGPNCLRKQNKNKQSPLTHKSQNSTTMKNTDISSLSFTIFNIWQYVNIPKVIMLSTVNCVPALMGLLYTTSCFSVKRKGSSMCMCIFTLSVCNELCKMMSLLTQMCKGQCLHLQDKLNFERNIKWKH